MNTPVKVILGLVGAAGLGYGAYRLYKWWKEEDALEEAGLTYDELVEQAEAKKIEEKMKERAEREVEMEEAEREIDGLPNDGYEWEKTPNGDIRRELTPYEKKNGVDYNPLVEEIIQEHDMDGNTFEYVQKYKQGVTKFLNHRDDARSNQEIMEAVQEMTAQIKALKNSDMEYERAIYEKTSVEALDYYRALLMDRNGIENEELRNKLAVLFSWEYLPDKENIGDVNIKDDIIRERIEHFGYGTQHRDWASIAEVIITYAKNLSFATNRGSVEQFADWIIETMGLDFDEDENVVINDTIVSYFSHGRVGKANMDGTYGLFRISKEAYNTSSSVYHEHNHAISDMLDDDYVIQFALKEDEGE